MSLHSETKTWIRANRSLYLLFNITWLAKKQQIQFYNFWLDPTGGSNPLSTILQAIMLCAIDAMLFLANTSCSHKYKQMLILKNNKYLGRYFFSKIKFTWYDIFHSVKLYTYQLNKLLKVYPNIRFLIFFLELLEKDLAWFMMFNATFNNISAISWRSVLLVEETGVPGENHRLVASHRQTLSRNVVLSTPRHERVSNTQL